MRDFYFDTDLLPGPVFQTQEAVAGSAWAAGRDGGGIPGEVPEV